MQRRLSTGLNLSLRIAIFLVSLMETEGKGLILAHGFREFFTILGSAGAGPEVTAEALFHSKQEPQGKRRDRKLMELSKCVKGTPIATSFSQQGFASHSFCCLPRQYCNSVTNLYS